MEYAIGILIGLMCGGTLGMIIACCLFASKANQLEERCCKLEQLLYTEDSETNKKEKGYEYL